MRIELAGTGVEVYCVHPAGVKTNIVRSIKYDDRKTSLRRRSSNLINWLPLCRRGGGIIIAGIERNNPRILIGGDARKGDLLARIWPSSYENKFYKWYKSSRFYPQQKRGV